MEPGAAACAALEGPGDLYRRLTAKLAPDALLLEMQCSDARGAPAPRDGAGAFLVAAPEPAWVWVSLTLWGFTYTHLAVSLAGPAGAGSALALSGALAFDPEKRAYHALARLPVAAAQGGGEAEGAYGERRRRVELRITATVATGAAGETSQVLLEGDTAVHLVRPLRCRRRPARASPPDPRARPCPLTRAGGGGSRLSSRARGRCRRRASRPRAAQQGRRWRRACAQAGCSPPGHTPRRPS